MNDLSFDIDVQRDKGSMRFEVTENYEGHKYHVVIFVDGEHWQTQGVNTGNQLLALIKRAERLNSFATELVNGNATQ